MNGLLSLTGILLFFVTSYVHAQSWTPASPNIYFNGGKVGIGTSSPQRLLHLSGSSSTGAVEGMIESTDDWYASLNFKSNGKTWQWGMRPSFENNSMQLWYVDPAIAGGGWQGPFFSVHTNGRVGIGLSYDQIPYYKLDILTRDRCAEEVKQSKTHL